MQPGHAGQPQQLNHRQHTQRKAQHLAASQTDDAPPAEVTYNVYDRTRAAYLWPS